MLKQIKEQMQPRWRNRRMMVFLEQMQLKAGAKVIDLGGTPELWEMIDHQLDITLLNLPNVFERYLTPSLKHHYKLIEGDACDLSLWPDKTFDLVFSNSVIEHIGPPKQQKIFAENVRRLAPSYWVQTPSIWFPIEAHCNLPLWWFYPPKLQQWWLTRWNEKKRLFVYRQMLETRVLRLEWLKTLFPEAKVFTEYFAGFPKSYSLYVPITTP